MGFPLFLSKKDMHEAIAYADDALDQKHGNGLRPFVPMLYPEPREILSLKHLKHWPLFIANDCPTESIVALKKISDDVIVVPPPDWHWHGIYRWKSSCLQRLPILQFIIKGERNSWRDITRRMHLAGWKIKGRDCTKHLQAAVDCGVLDNAYPLPTSYVIAPMVDRPNVEASRKEVKYGRSRQQRKRSPVADPAVAASGTGDPDQAAPGQAVCPSPEDQGPGSGLPVAAAEQPDGEPHGVAGAPADPVPLHLPQEGSVSIPASVDETGTTVVQVVMEQGGPSVEPGGREQPPQELGDAGEVGMETSGNGQVLMGEGGIPQDGVPRPVAGNGDL